MRVDLLCSGSKGNCCLIRTNNASILIDCGGPTKKYLENALKEVKQAKEDLDGIFITHTHKDHIGQLRHFASLPVYSYCEIDLHDPKGQPVALNSIRIRPLQPVFVKDLKITPIVMSHDSGPTTGFVVEDSSSRLVYVTDTGYVKNESLPCLKGADSYIFESNHDLEMLMATNRPAWLKQRIVSDTGHLCNQESARLLSCLVTENTKNIVLAHLSDEANTPALAMETLLETFAHAGISISGMKICAASQKEIVSF